MSRNSIFFLLGVAVLCLVFWAGYRVIEWRKEPVKSYQDSLAYYKNDQLIITDSIARHSDTLVAVDSIPAAVLRALTREDSGAGIIRIEYLIRISREIEIRDSLLRKRNNQGFSRFRNNVRGD